MLIKNWISKSQELKPYFWIAFLSTVIVLLAQKKDYWKDLSPVSWLPNLSFFINETRPLELVFTDDDPAAIPVALGALSSAESQTVKVPDSYKSSNVIYYCRGKKVEVVSENEISTAVDQSSIKVRSINWRNQKWLFWGFQLCLGFFVTGAIFYFWTRLLAVVLVSGFLEMVRVWSFPVYLLISLILLLWVLYAFLIKKQKFHFAWDRPVFLASLFALPCVTLALRSIAHPILHWDAGNFWLPRAAMIARHDTLFFNSLYTGAEIIPSCQGYPPLWSAMLSPFWSILDQSGFLLAPLMLGLLIAGLAEFLLRNNIHWLFVITAANFTYIYLYEHASYGYAQVVTASALFIFLFLLLGYRHDKRFFPLILLFALIIPLTRMESIVYLCGFLGFAWLLQRIPLKQAVVVFIFALVSFLAWNLTKSHYQLPSQDNRALDGIRILLSQSPWAWVERFFYILAYKTIFKKLNVEHYFLIVFVMTWLWLYRRRFKELFMSWSPVWLFILMMWGILLFLYFFVPVHNIAELRDIYLNTGFLRMYSHFIPAFFLLLPQVFARCQLTRDS